MMAGPGRQERCEVHSKNRSATNLVQEPNPLTNGVTMRWVCKPGCECKGGVSAGPRSAAQQAPAAAQASRGRPKLDLVGQVQSSCMQGADPADSDDDPRLEVMLRALTGTDGAPGASNSVSERACESDSADSKIGGCASFRVQTSQGRCM